VSVEGALIAEGKRSIGIRLKEELEHYAPDLCVEFERERLQEMSMRVEQAAEAARRKAAEEPKDIEP
jgi:hypothetical protein